MPKWEGVQPSSTGGGPSPMDGAVSGTGSVVLPVGFVDETYGCQGDAASARKSPSSHVGERPFPGRCL